MRHQQSSRKRKPHAGSVLCLEALEARRVLATVTWDGGGDGLSWSDPLNWDSDQLPVDADEVIIDLPGSDPTIEYSSGSLSLASLTSQEALHLRGGTLTVTGIGQINANLTIDDANLVADGPSAVVAATSSTSLVEATLRALNGGSLSVPATSFANGSSGNSTLEAEGAGSVLDLSSISTLSGGGFIRTLYIRAEQGGLVDLSGLNEITGGATHLIATDAGSRLDVSQLTSFTDTNGNRASLITPTQGGEVDMPMLTDLTSVDLTLDATGIVSTAQIQKLELGSVLVSGQHLDLSGVDSFRLSDLELRDGGTADISNVTDIDGASFEVFDGVTLTVPVPTTTYAALAETNTVFRANGVGSVLDLSAMATMSGGGFIRTHFIDAESGGLVNLSGLTEITGGATHILADGMGSRVELPILTTFTDTNGNRSSLMSPSAGGTIDAPLLTTLTSVDILVQPMGTLATSQMTSFSSGEMKVDGTHVELPQLTNFSNSSLLLCNGGTANVPNVSAIDGASFEVYDGVTLSLPSATSYVGQSNNTTRFRAQGPGSRLELSGVTTLSGGSFISTLFIDATDGGVVDLGGLSEITGGATNVLAQDAGSVVDFSMMTSFTDNNGNRESVLQPLNGGTLLAPQLNALSAVRVSLNGTGTLPTSQLTDVQGSNLIIENVFVDLSNVSNFTNSRLTLLGGGTTDVSQVTQINGASFFVHDGVTLAVPLATGYTGQSNDGTFFEAHGAGSRLDLSSITSFSGGSFISGLVIDAIAGGVVDLSGTQAITGGATRITADNGTIDLSAATQFSDTNGNVSSWLRSLNGGEVDFGGNTVQLSAVTTTLDETGTLTAGTFELGSGAVLDGVGALNASLVNSSIVRPGLSPGKITVQGDFTQTASGRLEVELGGAVPVSDYDVLEVTGQAALAGLLQVTLLNDLVPAERDAYDIMSYAGVNGTFDNYQGTQLASGLVLDPHFDLDQLTLNAFPELSLADATIIEGDVGVSQLVFDVTMTTMVGYDVSFDFTMRDGFAKAGEDYVFDSDTLMILAGDTTATVVVDILGDIGLERDETFFVELESPVDAALGDVTATGNILNDDTLPGVSIADVWGVEPPNGTTPFGFAVTLSAPAPDPVEVSFDTVDGTAAANGDYLATSGTVSFAASATRGLVSDGSDGPFTPTSSTTVVLPADGVLNYSHVDIPAGVTVTFTANAANTPVIMLSQGDFIVDGTIQVSASGRTAGPGGGDGGLKGTGLVAGTDGLGISPGTGGGAMQGFVGSSGAGGGLATAGLDPDNRPGPLPGTPGPAVPFPEELNDRGGSGGGGGGGWERFGDLSGGDGGGGGGGLIAASSHGAIQVNGAIRANGSDGSRGFANAFGWGGGGGGGSGGIIDLQADQIVVSGALEAVGGEGGGIGTIQPSNPDYSNGAHGGLGFVRLTTDDLDLTGMVDGELITRDLGLTQTVFVSVASDAMPMEPDEMFSVTLSDPINAVFLDAMGTGTIVEGTPGDVDGNGFFEPSDIDALIAALAAGSSDGLFDFNADGAVDLQDRDWWLAVAGQANLGPGRSYLVGDANLDGVVDGIDFLAWNNNKFTNTAAGTAGDFNGDGSVDGLDFVIWNSSKF
ncbi:MAG: Calx-beta domain-containing protein, partial [Planctomycetota bacterium]